MGKENSTHIISPLKKKKPLTSGKNGDTFVISVNDAEEIETDYTVLNQDAR